MAKKDAFIEFFEKYTNYQSIHVKLLYKKIVKNGSKAQTKLVCIKITWNPNEIA